MASLHGIGRSLPGVVATGAAGMRWSSMPSVSAVRNDVARLFSTARQGRPILGPSLARALQPLVTGEADITNPLAQVLGKRTFVNGMARWVTRKVDPEVLKRLEQTANRETGNVTAQLLYLNALANAGFGEEVISRVESGRFALTWGILDLYTRCLVDARRMTEPDAAEAKHRLRSMWSQYSGGGGTGATAVVPAEAIRGAVYGGGNSFGNTGGYYGGQPSFAGGAGFGSGAQVGSVGDSYFGYSGPSSSASPSSSSSYFGGASSSGSGYFGSSSSSSSSGGGAGAGPGPIGGATGYGSPGSRGNPMVVEVQTGRAGIFTNIMRLASIGITVALLYQLFGKSGMASPLANLTGDIAEEVTDVPSTRFGDVKGVDEAKAELQDVVAFLRDPERFKRLGAKVPRGVLLTGPPGTGKTLLARAVAGEAGCKFYSKSASEFEEMLVGLGAKRVRELFKSASKNAPAIIFIDEIDALGGKRKVSIGAGSERQTLNQLLSSMDGFSKNENVIVIAATNSPDILDPALTRPGRFDSTVDVPLPDVKGRKEILDLYLSKVVAARTVDSELLAKATPGFSGAQLEALVNSAALMAANRGADEIEIMDVEEARDKLIMGPAKKTRVRKAETMRLTAYHEGGHTLTALLTRGADPLHKVTILPRGFSGGATYSLPKDDELATRESILAQIDVSMGGRAAEELIYGREKITTGAGMDMSQASDLARRFCSVYSMSELGLSSYGNSEPSADRKAAIDTEVEKILQNSYARVLNLMTSHKVELDRLAGALLEHETLTAEECRQVVSGKQLPPLKERLGSLKQRAADDRAASGSSSSSSGQARSGQGAGSSGSRGGSAKDDKDGAGVLPKPKVGIWASVLGTGTEKDDHVGAQAASAAAAPSPSGSRAATAERQLEPPTPSSAGTGSSNGSGNGDKDSSRSVEHESPAPKAKKWA